MGLWKKLKCMQKLNVSILKIEIGFQLQKAQVQLLKMHFKSLQNCLNIVLIGLWFVCNEFSCVHSLNVIERGELFLTLMNTSEINR